MATIFIKNEKIEVSETYPVIKLKLSHGYKFIELTKVYDSGFPKDKIEKYKILINVDKIILVK